MIDRLFNTLSYKNDNLLGKLELENIELNKDSAEAKLYFVAKEPISIPDMQEFLDVLKAGHLYNVHHLSYDFKFESYTEKEVFEYYEFIINRLSKESEALLSALNYKKTYSDYTKTLNIEVPSGDVIFSLSRNQLTSMFKQLGFKEINLYLEIVNNDSEIGEIIKKEKEKKIKTSIKATSAHKWKTFLDDEAFEGRELKIKEVPDDAESFETLKSLEKRWCFVVKGSIKYVDEEQLEKKGNSKFILFDGESCCYCEKKITSRDQFNYFSHLTVGMECVVRCIPALLKNGDVVLRIINMKNSLDVKPITDRVDDQEEKRVELHLHTKMSAQDAIPSMNEYCEIAKLFGQKAIAVTDHGNVQSYHDLYEFCKKDKELKPLYGVELNYVDEDSVVVAYHPQDIELSEATFVVFDLETTGISVNYERIIEVSAVKIKRGMIIDRFSELVNPEKNIHFSVVSLTGITNTDVDNARKVKDVLTDFRKFIDGSILVAHNSTFDMGFLNKNFDAEGIEHPVFPVIDTLVLAKVLYPGHKRYTLDALSKLLNVTLNKHHRALEDATATGECFIQMLSEVMKKGVKYHSEINSIIDKNEVFKYPYPRHINLLVKNHTGLVNLYHIVSIASTTYFTDEPTVTKAVIEKYREGILVGSGCRNSYFFDTALNKNEEDLKNIIDFYDYIEVQPLNSFTNYKNHMDDYTYVITDTIKRIIALAKKHNIPVCATGDCHQINDDDLLYRKIMVETPTVGRQRSHYLKGEKDIPSEYYMTTGEMLSQFSFLGETLAKEIVVKNTNLIADACDFVESFSNTPYPPADDFLKDRGYPSAEKFVKDTVYNKAYELYGELLPGMVFDRVKHELDAIITNKFSTIYLISYLLVKKSNDDGYVVGSRGSVGSSFVAFLMNISEVNSLPPHYRCPKCHFSSFKMTKEEKEKYGIREDEASFIPILDSVDSGFDLPDKKCPICGTLLERDGHDIPFETFLGVPQNPKTPDIDLNFSGENQGQIHEYIRELFGKEKAFRAGTILTCQSKTAYSIVKDYYEKVVNKERIEQGLEPIVKRKAEYEALSQKIVESKRSCSQHPGGIVVVPQDHEIYEVTPVQYPGDSSERNWRTTHFDYHTFEKNLFKLDVLGHDDPTVLRYLMRFVAQYPTEFSFTDAYHIPVNDPELYKFMNGTECIGVSKEEILADVATYGISEFGTTFVRGLLDGAKPKTFGELVKVSGLSHGTDVWQGNAEDLLKGINPQFPVLKFKEVIGCRDDIMLDLINYGVPADISFQTMEFVRKGNAVKKYDEWTTDYVPKLQQYKVPSWFTWSCSKIGYMFPKAHATAYIIMALRIAWFKKYKPIFFYSAILSKKMTAFSPEIMIGGLTVIKSEVARLRSLDKFTKKAKDEDLQTTLELCLEMSARGFKIYNVDLYKSSPTEFAVSEDRSGLYLPFCSIGQLGIACAESIVKAREERPFTTQADFLERTQTSTTIFNKLKDLDVFKDLPEDTQMTLDLGI